jgi:hypothetical protein
MCLLCSENAARSYRVASTLFICIALFFVVLLPLVLWSDYTRGYGMDLGALLLLAPPGLCVAVGVYLRHKAKTSRISAIAQSP